MAEVRLPPRLREVAELVADGKSNKAIGKMLGISERTVETYVARLMRVVPGVGNSRVRIALWWTRQRG